MPGKHAMMAHSSKRSAVVTAVQLPSEVDRNRLKSAEAVVKTRLHQIVHELRAAGSQHPDLIVFGENGVTLGLRQDEIQPRLVRSAAQQALKVVAQECRRLRCSVVMTCLTLDPSGRLRNRSHLLGPQGTLLGIYDKVHCTETEKELGVAPGHEWPVARMKLRNGGCCSVGMMICHDMSFPESARCLMLNGAEMLVWPHLHSGWGDIAWDAMVRSRAIDNAVFLVSASYGKDPRRAWRPGMLQGRSGVMGPDGMILAEAGRDTGMVTAVCDLDAPLYKHDFTRMGDHPFRADLLADRRPETYGILTRIAPRS